MKTKIAIIFIYFFTSFHVIQAQETEYDKQMEQLAKKTALKAKETKKLNIAVWFFHTTRGKKNELGDYIGRDFSIHFTNASKGFNVIDRDHIEQLSEEHKWNEEGFINPQTAKQVGMITSADAIVTGTVDYGLHKLRIRIKIIDVETGRQLSAMISNVSLDENMKLILDQTNFETKNKTTKNYRIDKNEVENNQKTTDKNCEELKTGDYYFKNASQIKYYISLKKEGKRIASYSILPTEYANIIDMPVGKYDYVLADNPFMSVNNNYRQGSFRIEKCKSFTFVIKHFIVRRN
ncbi:hypothetical protein H2O64_21640 [Kordia sp. YSTF-M3]|uniref:Curli production assembly/transport component CsgG n=1 Tax=Kordia aestuariivivens TaxID=2759037 RepID=A0ABR7QFL1_9FLAO|nr:FlgO family outer membrane protein [Kordia aestuariivivens]MBC8757288.1 hypothetical protein [Kordia aestuariivivens]